MANIEESGKRVSEGLRKGTDTITSFFDSIKNAMPGGKYPASKPVKTSDGTVEIKADTGSAKASKKSLPERLMRKKFFFPALIVGGLLFVVFRRLK